MGIDFSSIPEYLLFEDLTSLDKIFGFVSIDIKHRPKHFKAADRHKVFLKMLDYYRDNGFNELREEYIQCRANKSYTNFQTVEMYNNFVFNHPLIVMLEMFIEQGLLTRDLKINSHVKKINLGEEILDRATARNMKIEEGVIFADGTLLKIESKEAHKIAALWLFLNGKNLEQAIRYTDDCIHPDPIFTSMSEYVKNIDSSDIWLTGCQAVAIYNIHLSKSRPNISFEKILENSKDLCVAWDGTPEVRYENVKLLERVLGKEIFNARKVLEKLREISALSGSDD